MSLDLWIGKPNRLRSKHALSFEPEAYYWFLYPLFEAFHASHGVMIDLYDGAWFEPGSFAPLFELFDNAEAMIKAQPEMIDVCVGTELGTKAKPENQKIIVQINRAEYLEFINELKSIVRRAQQAKQPLVFFGD